MNYEKFWTRIRDYANKKVREHHMLKYHHDRRCERCLKWTSEVQGAKSLREQGDYQYMTCKFCGHESEWFVGGMMPTLSPNVNLK